MKITQEDIKNTIEGLAQSFHDELMDCKESDLEKYWHYKFNPKLSDELNLYHFYDMLRLYSDFCRRWEEAKNGSCCVVERVRDKYIMPKIKMFLYDIMVRV